MQVPLRLVLGQSQYPAWQPVLEVQDIFLYPVHTLPIHALVAPSQLPPADRMSNVPQVLSFAIVYGTTHLPFGHESALSLVEQTGAE